MILDACRYDYFERIYGDYLEGKLLKALSEGNESTSWLRRNFRRGEYRDVVYTSANPLINSRGVGSEDSKLDGSKCFHKDIDAWDTGWSDEVETAIPDR